MRLRRYKRVAGDQCLASVVAVILAGMNRPSRMNHNSKIISGATRSPLLPYRVIASIAGNVLQRWARMEIAPGYARNKSGASSTAPRRVSPRSVDRPRLGILWMCEIEGWRVLLEGLHICHCTWSLRRLAGSTERIGCLLALSVASAL